MAREGYLGAGRAERARRASRFGLAASGWKPRRDLSQALDPVRAAVDSILGDDVEIVGDVVVHTTLDARAQRAAERAVSDRAAAIERGGGRVPPEGRELQGALVALDPRNGEIRALVGGRRFVQRGFNRALGARRQPGSAFKPFVYAAALADGYTPASAGGRLAGRGHRRLAGVAAGELRRRVRRRGHPPPRAHDARPMPPRCG